MILSGMGMDAIAAQAQPMGAQGGGVWVHSRCVMAARNAGRHAGLECAPGRRCKLNSSKVWTDHMRVRVVIVGGGPSGLLLSCLLDRAGIENIVLERRSRAYVLARIRAGILEQTSVDLLKRAGAGRRLDAEGIVHHAVNIGFERQLVPIALGASTGGKVVTAYGQTELTKDLADIKLESGHHVVYSASDVRLCDIGRDRPFVTWRSQSGTQRIDCDIIAGCDGFHGVSRRSVPGGAAEIYEKIYPFGWLGLLSDTPPVAHEVVYVNTPRGFALCSMRSMTRSRYYIQCPVDDRADAWSDEAFWDELKRRLPDELSDALVTGPSLEKSVAPLRSFVVEPLRFGRLFLAGDAAHVVPPTGAKGLNLAFSDVHYLFEVLARYFADKDEAVLDEYSRRALDRVWKTERFSWYLTNLTHRFNDDRFEQKMKEAELDYITSSRAGQTMLAENYVGLPL